MFLDHTMGILADGFGDLFAIIHIHQQRARGERTEINPEYKAAPAGRQGAKAFHGTAVFQNVPHGQSAKSETPDLPLAPEFFAVELSRLDASRRENVLKPGIGGRRFGVAANGSGHS